MPRVVFSLATAAVVAALALPGCASFRAARLYQSGTRALDHGEPARAIEQLEQAAALWPRGSEIQNHLGLAYASAGRQEEALEAFRRAVALDCENTAARANLAGFERDALGGAR